MTNTNSINKLSVILTKITDATNFYISDNEYTELCNLLRAINAKISPYCVMEQQAVPNIDWTTSIPIMAKLLHKLAELRLVEVLHKWHYVDNNAIASIPDMVTLAADFNLFFDRSESGLPFFINK